MEGFEDVQRDVDRARRKQKFVRRALLVLALIALPAIGYLWVKHWHKSTCHTKAAYACSMVDDCAPQDCSYKRRYNKKHWALCTRASALIQLRAPYSVHENCGAVGHGLGPTECNSSKGICQPNDADGYF